MHLGHLQRLIDYGDRVDRFAIATKGEAATGQALTQINAAAFGFRAHRSSDIAIETSRTFQVVSRFHRAIGVITILASAIFLLCIMLLKVEERRRDVAALRLLGISRRSVLSAIVIEASFIALLGSTLGALFGAVTEWLVNTHYQRVYQTPLLFAIITPELLFFSLGLSILLGIIAGALVGLRLVRTPPLALFGR
jgi:putative ABC transport system permease protein